MMLMRTVAAVVFGLCTAGAACSQDAPSEAAQREQIRQQRQKLESDNAQRALACRDQFVVTRCLAKARADKQEALHLLREQELTLDAAKREQRAAEYAARVKAKTQAAAQAEQQASASRHAEGGQPRVPPAAAKTQRTGMVASEKKPPSASSAASRSAQESHHREQFELRQREAQAHREAVERRNAERSGQQRARPLPVPDAASGAVR